jgi:hypothetical protein
MALAINSLPVPLSPVIRYRRVGLCHVADLFE